MKNAFETSGTSPTAETSLQPRPDILVENGAGEAPLPQAISSPAVNTPDFEVSNLSSIYILTALTLAAREWVAEFLPQDAQQWAGGTVIEWRFIAGIVRGAQHDGLTVVQS
jgi:hypothetical protein